jgi:3-oxoacyl-[acyl-carrier-protein] synthase I
VAVEEGHLYSEVPYRGEGLARAIEDLVVSGTLPLPVREVYSSMNGERHWAKEWGVSLLRNRAAFDPDHGMHHPADCTGDTGAACGPLMVGLAALGVAGGYRRSPCLVYGSSDDGARAVLGVTAA